MTLASDIRALIASSTPQLCAVSGRQMASLLRSGAEHQRPRAKDWQDAKYDDDGALIALLLNHATQIADALEAVEWMPIEGAPRGKAVIVNTENWGVTEAIQGDDGWQIASMNGTLLKGMPTHWRPLPTPPTKDHPAQ